MSLSQIILACNWLLEGDLKNKFYRFWRNKPALVLSSLLLLHFIGLLYTSDFAFASNDIRIKSPLFILPLIISTSKPLSLRLFSIVLQVFVAAVIFGTIVSTLILTGIIHRPIVDVRQASIFISHIRFALLICVSVFISVHFIYNNLKVLNKIIWSAIVIWLLAFLILMESITGLSVLICTAFLLVTYFIITTKSKILKWGGITVILISLFSLFSLIRSIVEPPKKEIIDLSQLVTTTSQGNAYQFDPDAKQVENGHYVWMYYCTKELEQSWDQRSKIKFYSKDLKGNDIRFTLMRYLASKGLKKDAAAMDSLTDEEIKAVERGVVNVNYSDVSSLAGRIHEIAWEVDLYKTTGDPNGHSLTQRFEYWKAAFSIINNNRLIGVGTGDVQQEFDKQYKKVNSPLIKEWRLRAHNQYLSIAVAFGIVGLIWFLFTLIYPMVKQKMTFDYLYISFFIITIISFLTEDTLETQAGVTFYAFLNSFFLFGREKEE